MNDQNTQTPGMIGALTPESAEDLYEHAPCGYLSMRPDGLILRVNQTFLTWSGYAREDIVNQHRFVDLLRVGGKLYYETHFAPLLHMHGVADEIAFDIVCKDGRILPTLVNAVQLRDATGRPTFLRLTIFNATERRRYEQELLFAKRAAEQSATNLQQILSVLPVAVLIAGVEGRVSAANDAMRKLVGHHETVGEERHDEELLARACQLRYVDGALLPESEQPIRQALQLGEVIQNREAYLYQNGSANLAPVLVSSAPLKDGEGQVKGAVVVFQDITLLKEMEQAREMFLAAVTHDLKTPITVIRSHAQIAERRLRRLESTEMTAILGNITPVLRSTDTMLAMIAELLDVTKGRMGSSLDLNRVPTDLVALVQGSVENQRSAKRRGIHFATEMTRLDASVDAARLTRVVGNLLTNAIKYSPSDSAIWVWLGQEENEGRTEAVLTVRDEGIGIPADDLPYIFERFRRAKNVTRRVEGTGIGLASVKLIVEQHGGTISVESTEHIGSTFTVRLPLPHAPPPDMKDSQETA